MASKGVTERKCGKADCSNIGNKKCSRCKKQFYCSKDCQKTDWKTHKKTCKIEKQEPKKKVEKNKEENESSYSFQNVINFAMRRMLGEIRSLADEYMQDFPNDKQHGQLIRKYENWYCQTVLEEKMKMKRISDREFTAPGNFVKRWGEVLNDGDCLLSFLDGPRRFGDIYVRKSYPPYNNLTYQTMRNTGTANQIYEFGHTYVGFGYVDLFQLVWGSFRNTTEKLQFYGWDMNRVTVLRSKLIYIIFKYFTESEINTLSALQIWFSSCWDSVTLNAFNYLIDKILGETQKYDLCDEDVALLKLWKKTKISVHEAQSKFSNNQPRDTQFDVIWRMKAVKDRIMFSRYLFTGCIFAEEDITVCGNPTMFTSYKGQTKVDEELFFKGIDLGANDITQEARKNESESLFDTLTSSTVQAVLKFRGLVKTEKIVCYLETKLIDPSDMKFAAQIQALNPFNINWSNLPDFMEKKSFIKFARACSFEDTTHQIHFLNWCRYVLGSCHVDWKNDQEKCNALYDDFIERKIIAEKVFRNHDKMTDFFTGPAYTNSLNGVNLMLSTMFRQTFEDFFLSDENGKVLNRYKTNVCDGQKTTFFNQSPTMFRTFFTFNDKIRLNFELTT